jgi:hypothetical protein
LNNGDALAGDLAMNGFPLRLGPGLPMFAEDMKKVRDSLELLLNRGAKKDLSCPRQSLFSRVNPGCFQLRTFRTK